MPQPEKTGRNRDIIQLKKIGWSQYALAKHFNIEKRNLKRLLKRDWDKYPYPNIEDLKSIEERNNISISPEVKAVIGKF